MVINLVIIMGAVLATLDHDHDGDEAVRGQRRWWGQGELVGTSTRRSATNPMRDFTRDPGSHICAARQLLR